MDTLVSTVIGAVIALAGVFTTNLIGLVREKRQRIWSMEDMRRDHKLSVLERRLVQTENYLEAMTSDVRSVMHEAEFYLGTDDPHEAKQKNKQRKASKQSRDTKIFAQGPAIRSLGDEELDTLWPQLIEALETMGAIYSEIFDLKFENQQLVDASFYVLQINGTWLDYSGALASFYQRLDDIRRESFDIYL